MQRRTIHQLKSYSWQFEELLSEKRPFEIRKNGLDFKIGDILHIKEWTGGIVKEFTGREVFREITCINTSFFDKGVMEGYCILGIRKVDL